MGGVPEGGPLGVHVQGRGDPEGGVTALAGKGASQPHTVGRAEARSEGGSEVETWASCRRSQRGPGGRLAAGGRPRGRRSARCVHTGQCVRAGRRSVPQWRHTRGAEAGGVAGARGGGSHGRGIGDGAPGRRGGQPRRGGRRVGGKWEERKVAQARVGRSGALEAGRVSGRASQLCLRALGNMVADCLA